MFDGPAQKKVGGCQELVMNNMIHHAWDGLRSLHTATVPKEGSFHVFLQRMVISASRCAIPKLGIV